MKLYHKPNSVFTTIYLVLHSHVESSDSLPICIESTVLHSSKGFAVAPLVLPHEFTLINQGVNSLSEIDVTVRTSGYYPGRDYLLPTASEGRSVRTFLTLPSFRQAKRSCLVLLNTIIPLLFNWCKCNYRSIP